MNRNVQTEHWLEEERNGRIHGWDFSHILADGRCTEEPLPWDFRQVVLEQLRPEHRILDLDTGGGEFLLSLGHPPERTAATEGYPPNVALCRETLLPLGLDFRPASDPEHLPFADRQFDLILNRHGSFSPREVYRLLKPGGVFLTQQVGADNDRELVELLLPETPRPFPEQTLDALGETLTSAGFALLRREEHRGVLRFYDVGALVWFACVIPWEFPGFSVGCCWDRLLLAQERLEQDGVLTGRTHRILLAARKPEYK